MGWSCVSQVRANAYHDVCTILRSVRIGIHEVCCFKAGNSEEYEFCLLPSLCFAARDVLQVKLTHRSCRMQREGVSPNTAFAMSSFLHRPIHTCFFPLSLAFLLSLHIWLHHLSILRFHLQTRSVISNVIHACAISSCNLSSTSPSILNSKARRP